jgi:hypothetical protein
MSSRSVTVTYTILIILASPPNSHQLPTLDCKLLFIPVSMILSLRNYCAVKDGLRKEGSTPSGAAQIDSKVAVATGCPLFPSATTGHLSLVHMIH